MNAWTPLRECVPSAIAPYPARARARACWPSFSRCMMSCRPPGRRLADVVSRTPAHRCYGQAGSRGGASASVATAAAVRCGGFSVARWAGCIMCVTLCVLRRPQGPPQIALPTARLFVRAHPGKSPRSPWHRSRIAADPAHQRAQMLLPRRTTTTTTIDGAHYHRRAVRSRLRLPATLFVVACFCCSGARGQPGCNGAPAQAGQSSCANCVGLAFMPSVQQCVGCDMSNTPINQSNIGQANAGGGGAAVVR
eukprot:COSAG01_NODE_18425_length_1077_cov_1.257669_1_plen_251_part_00